MKLLNNTNSNEWNIEPQTEKSIYLKNKKQNFASGDDNASNYWNSDNTNVAIETGGNVLSSLVNSMFNWFGLRDKQPDNYTTNNIIQPNQPNGESKTGLYIGVGAGVLVLVVILIFALKK